MLKIIPYINDKDLDDLYSNTYLIIDDNNSAVVIDPSFNDSRIIDYLIKENVNLKAILLTHGHFDHIRGVDILVNKFSVPVYIFYLDEEMLSDSYLNGSNLLSGKEIIIQSKPITIKDKEILHLLKEEIEVIWTPFHTVGSVCYYFKESQALFSGDTLFKEGIGRYDLPMNDKKSKKATLDKLMLMDDDIKVYPGHGPKTLLGKEKKFFLFY